MAAVRMPLRLARTASLAQPCAALRELTGADELSVEGIGTRSAAALLGRLVTFDVAPELRNLSASDRDSLLAGVYRMTFGERVQSTVVCASCRQRFDIDFALRQLEEHLFGSRAETLAAIESDGVVVTRSGLRLSLPDLDDELAAAQLPRAAAVGRLAEQVVDADDVSPAEAADALERIAPIFDLELDAECPECGHAQKLAFDLQSYLLSSVLNERVRLHADVHALASAYGWSLSEILALTRRQRRGFVATLDEANRRAADARRGGIR